MQPEAKRIPIWLDTDPGVDDAAAIFLAARMPELDVVGVSAVAGNVGHDHTFRNARDLASLGGLGASVYPGSTRPLLREPHYAGRIHGGNGIQNVELEPSEKPQETTLAWDAIYEAARRFEGRLVLVPIGPLTNIARALLAYPELKSIVAEIVLMGGAVIGGNATPAAEFNIFFDPEAAEIVFASGIPLTMLGLDVTMKALIGPDDIAAVAAGSGPAERFLGECLGRTLDRLRAFGFDRLAMHDPCTLLYLVYPELFEGEMAGVRVETTGRLTAGKTVCDLYSDFQFEEKNCRVITGVDSDAFKARFLEILAREPAGA